MARCTHDYGTSLAKEVEGQMSIVTQLPDVSAQSRVFISDRSKVHGMVTYIHKKREGTAGKSVGGNTGGCVCVCVCVRVCVYKTCRFGVKHLGWV